MQTLTLTHLQLRLMRMHRRPFLCALYQREKEKEERKKNPPADCSLRILLSLLPLSLSLSLSLSLFSASSTAGFFPIAIDLCSPLCTSHFALENGALDPAVARRAGVSKNRHVYVTLTTTRPYVH